MTTERNRRTAHPLLQRFPVAVMSLATFLVVFALLMARASRDTWLDSRASSAQVASVRSGAAVRTTASGTSAPTAGAATGAAAGHGSAAASRPVFARASGAGATSEADDG